MCDKTLKQCIHFEINKNKQKAWNMMYIRQKQFQTKYYKKHKNARCCKLCYQYCLKLSFQIIILNHNVLLSLLIICE